MSGIEGNSTNASISRFQGISDVCDLPSIAEDTVLALLRERYISSNPYTALSPNALISINPFAHQPINGDQTLQDYIAEHLESSVDDSALRNSENETVRTRGPHIFRTAYNAYYNMQRTRQDQIIVLSGATGSGKSEIRRLAIRAISELAAPIPGKRGSKIGSQVANAEFILESFGHAHTLSSDNASRFGNYTELQFSDSGKLEGLKTIEYYLERSRVSHPLPVGERNFHVFYYLVSGIHGEEKSHLKLRDVHDYRYLQCRVRRSGPTDQQRFDQLKQAFRIVGLSNRLVAQICQLLATILHLGNLQFHSGHSTAEGSTATDADLFAVVADFLGVASEALAELFSVKTMLIGKEICTAFLEVEEAEKVRDELARTLYSLLFSWLNEFLNQKLCKDSFGSFIAILDLPGPQTKHGVAGEVNSVDQFCFNIANEKVHNWLLQRIHVAAVEEADRDTLKISRYPYFDNLECVELLGTGRGSLIHMMDDHARKRKTDSSMVDAMGRRHAGHASFALDPAGAHGERSFTINHYSGPVSYTAENFLEQNANETSADVMRLLRGDSATTRSSSEYEGSNNPFIKSLFSSKAIATRLHPRNDNTIVAVQQSVKPMRAPSTRRKRAPALQAIHENSSVDAESVGGGNDESGVGQIQCIAGQHWSALTTLLDTFEHAQPWYIFCLKPNDSQLSFQMDIRVSRFQIRSLGITELALRLKSSCEIRMTHAEACERYKEELTVRGIAQGPPDAQRLADLQRVLRLTDEQMAIGSTRVFLSHGIFHRLEDRLRAAEGDHDAQRAYMPTAPSKVDHFSPYNVSDSPMPSPGLFLYDSDDRDGSNLALPLVLNAQPLRQPSPDMSDHMADHMTSYGHASAVGDSASNFGTDRYAPSKNMFQSLEHKEEKDVLDLEPSGTETTEVYKESIARRRWVWLCTILTFWIPGFLLSGLGGMKRPDIRQAWREKLTINLIIWSICLSTIFVIAALGPIICPTQHVFSTSELNSHSYKNDPNNAFIAIRGEVFDLSQFVPTHLAAVSVVSTKSVLQYGGLDASNLFPVQVNALCGGTTGALSPWVTLDSTNTTDPFMKYHDFRAFTNDSRPDWYSQMMVMLRHRFRVGFMGYTKKDIKNMVGTGRAITIIDGMVYEITTYISQNGGGLRAPNGTDLSSTDQQDRQFLANQVISLFIYESGKDVTQLLDNLAEDIGAEVVASQKQCLRNLFLIGEVDTRDSAQCQFSTYILLALSIVMVSIIGFKFIAAIHFGSSRAPENHDKFIICQVPCYTESEESLRRTIDSLARLKYDDKRKLLMVICDGNIKGFGNEKPTPAIVLDILGVDPNLDPEPLSFQSLGEGSKQHNMGKVYAGLYECAGHVVPYMVVVKVGKPTERPKPGNRGKRDSQMVLMHFLNKVHYNAPMNPLELEMYHQMKNVVGVSPTFYEYIFMVDADTTVEELSLNRLVSAMMHDKKIIGACGETSITNAKQSIVTMSQVYEYFISHHLAKSFESLFGSITCLPGCFSIYRLRTPDSHKPLFISNQIVHDYAENRVDTLHLKNLLHLGEDRYLTTLVLKHFPTYKTKFVRDAHAQTVAPDSASVLLSQRRRWINSTVHNLAELVFLDQLCGFCCFSMRFVVFIDLLSTIVAPVTVAYIGYLIYLIVHSKSTIPILSIIMLAAIYGLQALVFIFRMRWDMIAWMIFYILAIPVFSFFLPLYSFWKMDDFSWGSTRLVVGERGKKIVIHDEGKFDLRSIPLKNWSDYENELWEHDGDDRSLESFGPLDKFKLAFDSGPPSSYGGHEHESPQFNKPLSHAGSYPELRYSRYQIPQLGYEPSQALSLSRPDNLREMRDELSNPIGTTHAAERQSIYSLVDPGIHRQSAQDVPRLQSRPQSHHFEDRYVPLTDLGCGAAKQTSSLLGSTQSGGYPANGQRRYGETLGPSNLISGDSLLNSIVRICAQADLETLTKRSVRQQLEEEYGVDLGSRKDEISRMVERVIEHDAHVE